MTKRISYREGISWIAGNDEPDSMDPEFVAQMISVQMLADLSRKWPEEVAAAVIRYRDNHNF